MGETLDKAVKAAGAAGKVLKAAKDMGGDTGKPPARQGGKPGPKPRWEPEPGKQYTGEEIHAVELDLESEGISDAERADLSRRLRIMQRRLKLSEFELPIRFLAPPIPRLAARITGWNGWIFTKEQLEAIVEAGSPAMREIWPGLVSGRGGAVAVFIGCLFDIFDHKLDGYLDWRKTQTRKGGDGDDSPGSDDRRE